MGERRRNKKNWKWNKVKDGKAFIINSDQLLFVHIKSFATEC